MKRRSDVRQMDLFKWADNRPTAKIISALPALEKKLFAEMFRTDFSQKESAVLPLRHDQRRRAS